MNSSLNRSPRPQTSGALYGLLTASLLGLSVLALTFVGLSQASSEPTEVVKLSSTLSHAQVTADQRATVYLKVDLEGLSLGALRPGGRLAVFGPHGEAQEMLDVLRDNGFVPVEEDLEGLSSEELDQRLAEGIVFRPVQ